MMEGFKIPKLTVGAAHPPRRIRPTDDLNLPRQR